MKFSPNTKYKVKHFYHTLKPVLSGRNSQQKPYYLNHLTKRYSSKSSIQQTSSANVSLTETDLKQKTESFTVYERFNETVMSYAPSFNDILYKFKSISLSNESVVKMANTTIKQMTDKNLINLKEKLSRPLLKDQYPTSLLEKSPPKSSKKDIPEALSATADQMELKIIKLCDSITRATSSLIRTILINDLFKVLYDKPNLRYVIYRKRNNLLKELLTMRTNAEVQGDNNLMGNINECLALMGYIDQTGIKHNGINILSLDGGGSKGFVSIEVLKNIEQQCGKPIHEIFDYICGVSTGAVLTSLIGILKMPLSEVERLYALFTRDLFERNVTTGLGNLFKSYAYYDTQMWENMLQDVIGDRKLINTARDGKSCKIGIVSNVTTSNQMKVFLFRNYNLPTWAQSHYDGTCRHKIWQAVRASSAAPGFYEDFKIDDQLFYDGGLLANNPAAVAIHEAKQIWPKTKINCIVSVGNGRIKPAGYDSTKVDSIGLKQKITRIFSGIGDPENVHTILLDTMAPSTYFRFNPHMTEEFNLDEKRPEKWKLMQHETNMYMRRNDYKINKLSKQLLKPKSTLKKLHNYLITKHILNVSFRHEIY